MRARMTIAVFCTLLFGLALANLLTPDRTFSEHENRYLTQRPEFTFRRLRTGVYTASFEDYVVDQFVGRDGWVSAKTLTEKSIGKRSSSGVYFARDGALIEMFDTVDEAQYRRNLAHVAAFFSTVQAETEIRPSLVLVPTASGILTRQLPAFAPEVDQAALLDEAAALVPQTADITGALEGHASEDIYYRTDHHWTSLGAYYGYRSWREQTGQPAAELEHFERQVLSDRFYGTTYSKASLYTVPPDTITAFLPRSGGVRMVDYNNGEERSDSIYERSYLEKKDKYAVFLNANQPIVHIYTEADNGKRLLLVKDSYANTFVQFLLNDYEEIVVVDLRYYRQSVCELAQDSGATDLLVLYNVKGFSNDANLFYLNQ